MVLQGLTAHEAIGLTKAQWDAAAQVEAAQPVLTKLEACVPYLMPLDISSSFHARDRGSELS